MPCRKSLRPAKPSTSLQYYVARRCQRETEPRGVNGAILETSASGLLSAFQVELVSQGKIQRKATGLKVDLQ